MKPLNNKKQKLLSVITLCMFMVSTLPSAYLHADQNNEELQKLVDPKTCAASYLMKEDSNDALRIAAVLTLATVGIGVGASKLIDKNNENVLNELETTGQFKPNGKGVIIGLAAMAGLVMVIKNLNKRNNRNHDVYQLSNALKDAVNGALNQENYIYRLVNRSIQASGFEVLAAIRNGLDEGRYCQWRISDDDVDIILQSRSFIIADVIEQIQTKSISRNSSGEGYILPFQR